MTYLYCVLTPADRPPSLDGLAGAPVRALRLADGALEAWVATVDRMTLRVSGRALATLALIHDQVVSAALGSGRTPLPARFGSLFPDDASCVRALGARASQLRTTLTHLSGKIEMSVILTSPNLRAGERSMPLPARNESSAGRRYLEVVRERARHAEQAHAATETVFGHVRRAVHGFVLEEAPGRATRGTASIAHLVRREDETRYRDAVEALETLNDVRLVIAGPRAPYSFAGPIALPTGHDSGSPDHSG